MSLRALSHLLTYPDGELRAHLDELQQVLHGEHALDKGAASARRARRHPVGRRSARLRGGLR